MVKARGAKVTDIGYSDCCGSDDLALCLRPLSLTSRSVAGVPIVKLQSTRLISQAQILLEAAHENEIKTRCA